eukprot:3935973-Rhodomonas_salina.1
MLAMRMLAMMLRTLPPASPAGIPASAASLSPGNATHTMSTATESPSAWAGWSQLTSCFIGTQYDCVTRERASVWWTVPRAVRQHRAHWTAKAEAVYRDAADKESEERGELREHQPP